MMSWLPLVRRPGQLLLLHPAQLAPEGRAPLLDPFAHTTAAIRDPLPGPTELSPGLILVGTGGPETGKIGEALIGAGRVRASGHMTSGLATQGRPPRQHQCLWTRVPLRKSID